MKKKFSAPLIGGAISTILVWGCNAFSGIQIPPEVATAFGALATYGASALIPDEVEE